MVMKRTLVEPDVTALRDLRSILQGLRFRIGTAAFVGNGALAAAFVFLLLFITGTTARAQAVAVGSSLSFEAWVPLFFPVSDGSAYLLKVEELGYSLVRIRSNLQIDPEFRTPQLDGNTFRAAEVAADGSLIVGLAEAADRLTLLRLNSKGVAVSSNAVPGLGDSSVYFKADANNDLYIASAQKILRVKAAGSIDESFQPPRFEGEILNLWWQNDFLYVGGNFQNLNGIARTNLAVFRIHRTTGFDPQFAIRLTTNQSTISGLVALPDRIVTYGYPQIRVHSFSGVETGVRTVDYGYSFQIMDNYTAAQHAWRGLVQLENGRIFGSVFNSECHPGCTESSGIDEITWAGEQPRQTPFFLASEMYRSYPKPIFSAGNFLWTQASESPLPGAPEQTVFKRYSFLPAGGQSFGFEQAEGVAAIDRVNRSIASIRRFGEGSEPVEVEVRVELIESDAKYPFEPFVIKSLTSFETPQFLDLPASLQVPIGSVSLLRLTLQTPNVNSVGGTVEALVWLTSVDDQSESYSLKIHRLSRSFSRPLFTLSGPVGDYSLEATSDFSLWVRIGTGYSDVISLPPLNEGRRAVIFALPDEIGFDWVSFKDSAFVKMRVPER